jgi:AcrR family transcriptional regulator
VSIAYELEGRTGQKLRTRDALIRAARELIARGASPTVEDAATAAAISRTTAYRYFKNQAALLAAAHPETAKSSLLPATAPSSSSERVRLVVSEFLRIITNTEAQQRTMLRLSLEERRDPAPLVLRQGRAIAWLEDALSVEHERLGARAIHRLAVAIRSATGIESLVWLTDVAGLSRKEAVKLMLWSADALLRAALDDATRAKKTRSTPKRPPTRSKGARQA